MSASCQLCDPALPPPGDANMDMAVISCLMAAPEFAVEKALELLKPDDFSTEACGLLFDIITQRHAGGKLVDPVSLTSLLYDKDMIGKVGGPAFVSDCYTASPNPAHVTHYAQEVLTASRKRQMLKIASDLARAVREGAEGSEDWRDALLPVLRRADGLLMDRGAGDILPFKEIAGQYLDFFDSDPAQLDPPTATGIKGVDKIMVGGLRKEYLLIGGKQGDGKSLLAMQIAGQMANAGKRGLLVGYDMSPLQVVMRDIARQVRVPVTHVMGREPMEGMEPGQISAGLTRMVNGWDVWYTTSPYVTFESAAGHARTLNRQKKLDFIVWDFLQAMPKHRGGQKRTDELLVELSGCIGKLRKELDNTAVGLVQINDDGLIREARGILDEPETFIRIEMDEAENLDGEMDSGDTGFLRFLKNRFGPKNRRCPVFRNGAYQCFEDREFEPKKQEPRPNRRPYRH